MVRGDRCKNRFRGGAGASPSDQAEESDDGADKGKGRKHKGIKKKTQYELAFMRRKALRDKGLWKPQVPPYTPCTEKHDSCERPQAVVEEDESRHFITRDERSLNVTTIEVSGVDMRSVVDISRQASAERAAAATVEPIEGPPLAVAQEATDDDNESKEKEPSPKIDPKLLRIQEQAERFKQSKFSSTVKLNTNDYVPDGLLGDFWDVVEDFHKYPAYTNHHIKSRED